MIFYAWCYGNFSLIFKLLVDNDINLDQSEMYIMFSNDCLIISIHLEPSIVKEKEIDDLLFMKIIVTPKTKVTIVYYVEIFPRCW